MSDWIDRSPGVKRLLEPSEDEREGVSVEPPALPRHVYTLDYGAGATIRVDGASAVRWSPGTTLLGIALTHAEPGDTIRMPISEVSGTYERERGAPRGARRPTPMTACRAQHQAWHWEHGNIWTYA